MIVSKNVIITAIEAFGSTYSIMGTLNTVRNSTLAGCTGCCTSKIVLIIAKEAFRSINIGVAASA